MKRIILITVALIAATALAGDDANPHDLRTIAAKAAWRNYERDVQAEQARHDREVKNIRIRAIADLHKARSLAAKQENADEIVRIDAAIEGLNNHQSVSPEISGRWVWQNGFGAITGNILFKDGKWKNPGSGEWKSLERESSHLFSYEGKDGRLVVDTEIGYGVWRPSVDAANMNNSTRILVRQGG